VVDPHVVDPHVVDAVHLPEGTCWALELVDAPPQLRPALAGLLHRVVVADGLASARAVVAAAATRGVHVVAVTREGDLLGAGFAAGGSQRTQSRLEVQAAVDAAETDLRDAIERVERANLDLGPTMATQAGALGRVEAAGTRLHESDAQLAVLSERLAQLGSLARGAAAEADRLARTIATAEEALATDRDALAALEARLAAAEVAPGADDEEPGGAQRDRMSLACSQARDVELEARLAVRTQEERVRALAGRADALERAAAAEREARARAAARQERRARGAAVAGAVADTAREALECVAGSLAAAAHERTAAEAARDARERELDELRSLIRVLGADLDELVDSVHRDEVARAEQTLRIEALRATSLGELGMDPDLLVDEYGPHQPVRDGVGAGQGADQTQPRPYDRGEQTKRLRRAEHDLAALGRVNPLALEEFAALEERHRFLGTQLEDLRATRRDLLDIVREVDERVEQVFTAAFWDTAAQFEQVFARLFPGGEGRLVLTDPQDMLTTGIEVEARPPGKKIKRLSLLSGGERSLTAVALLVAIFKARPSPFYVMDEVEAALDDTNLGRLLILFEELRESSQLIVVTHQKRTMEVADTLYGVTMRDDGVTTVISQRLQERASA
jgi:chromosome segregation protein